MFNHIGLMLYEIKTSGIYSLMVYIFSNNITNNTYIFWDQTSSLANWRYYFTPQASDNRCPKAHILNNASRY
jgi:hypothetical protein